MQFTVKDLQRDPVIQLDEVLAMPQIANESKQLRIISQVHATLTVTLEQAFIHATGSACAEAVYECARCLTAFKAPLTGHVDEMFTLVDTQANDDVHFVSGPVILLDPFIEEALFLEVEYRPLCREDCKGLCPNCGCNWNEASCSCDNQKIDPRLLALKDLLSQGDSE